jgi:galactose-1-phosphate uridylyltransferase
VKIQFRKEQEIMTFHDPTQEGKLIGRATEIRYDPLTGETSRILFDSGTPFVPPDYTDAATKGWCPFCEANVMTATPRFPAALAEEDGRITSGEAVLFPNLFPYAKHNAVVRITRQHYVRLEEFSAEQIRNAFGIAHRYLERVLRSDPAVKYISINWNYLPVSGGSILHPHIQPLVSEHPSVYQAVTAAAAEKFLAEHGVDYFTALVAEERRLGARWIGQQGMLQWVHAFAPRSHMDFIGVFRGVSAFRELEDTCWDMLADSLMRLFPYLAAKGLAGFNLALFMPMQPDSGQMVHVRLVPRLTYGALDTSDIHALNFLHRESLSMKVPESIAAEAAAYFGDQAQ